MQISNSNIHEHLWELKKTCENRKKRIKLTNVHPKTLLKYIVCFYIISDTIW